MAKIGSKPHATAKTVKHEPSYRQCAATVFQQQSTVVTLTGKMTVFGSFKRVPGLLEAPKRRTVEQILDFLNASRTGAEFIGQHAGRRVVGVKHRACACIEFADCRSPLLPPLPTTGF